jgi:uncharacterized protein YacL
MLDNFKIIEKKDWDKIILETGDKIKITFNVTNPFSPPQNIENQIFEIKLNDKIHKVKCIKVEKYLFREHYTFEMLSDALPLVILIPVLCGVIGLVMGLLISVAVSKTGSTLTKSFSMFTALIIALIILIVIVKVLKG